MKKVLCICLLIMVSGVFGLAIEQNAWADHSQKWHRHQDNHKLAECGNKDPHIFYDAASQTRSDEGAGRIGAKASVCSEGYLNFLWGVVENKKVSDELVITLVTVAMSNTGSVHIDPMDGAYILQYGVENGRWPDWKSEPKQDPPDIIDKMPALKPDQDLEL